MTATAKTGKIKSRDIRHTYKVKRWVHPGTGEVRVYFNMPELAAKVWTTRDAEGGYKIGHRHESRYDYPYERESRPWEHVVEAVLDELKIDETWDAMLAATV